MDTIIKHLLTACLTYKKHAYELPYGKSFINYKLSKTELNIEKYKKLKSVADSVQHFAHEYKIKICAQFNDEIFCAGKGPELFIRLINGVLIFHSNIAKIAPLPTGLDVKRGITTNLTTLATCRTKQDVQKKYFTMNDDLNKIEKCLGYGIEVWHKKKSNSKPILLRKAKVSTKKQFHCENIFNHLIFIKKPKLYFRGYCFLRK
jgi:hypothetical protein